MPFKLSHSRVELYKQCPKKYEFQYVEKYYADKTRSALLFGKAIDKALNYVLKQKKNAKTLNVDYAKKLFKDVMKEWKGQNEFDFFKSEIPEDQFEEDDHDGNQVRSWTYLYNLGQQMIDTYIAEFLPLIKTVVEIQKRKQVKNENGDVFTLVLDCIVEFHGGKVVLLDHKTAGKPYPKNSVVKSEQLAIYNEHYPVKYCGYAVFHKKLKDGKVTWQLLVDEIPEEMKAKAYEGVQTALTGLESGEFPKNPKSCWAYGKKCDYYSACYFGNYGNLLKK